MRDLTEDMSVQVRRSGSWVDGTIERIEPSGRVLVRITSSGKRVGFDASQVRAQRTAVSVRRAVPDLEESDEAANYERARERSTGTVRAPLVAVPKVKTARSSSHLEHVRSLPCAWCGKPGPSEPSHHGAHGMAIKASDYYTLPLCHEHHRGEWHQHGKLGHMSAEQTKAWATEQALRVCAERLSCRAAAQKESE